MSTEAARAVVRVLEDAIAAHHTPGAQAAVATLDDERALQVAAGALFADRDPPAVDDETVYDLASLTKVLATTVLAAHAVTAGALDLDETPWPSWPRVSVRHALWHEAGLPAWRPFFESVPAAYRGLLRGRDDVVRQVHETAPERAPGRGAVYSDLGFIALGALLEERLSASLDVLFRDVAAPFLDAPGLRYVPLHAVGYHPALPRVAPTERCPWRGRVVHGQVHDDNCFAMGGVAGHAGLFGTATDVLTAARTLGAAVRGDDARPLARQLAHFAHTRGPGGRGLGFDVVTAGGSTGGALSEQSVGHLGFTGTSLWLDPAGPGAVYVLLTNRVHPSRDNDAIRTLRPAFHAAARAWVDAASG